MRKEFIECKTLKMAWLRAPWAEVMTKVEGGYMAFESRDDFNTWKNQK